MNYNEKKTHQILHYIRAINHTFNKHTNIAYNVQMNYNSLQNVKKMIIFGINI